MGKAPLILQYLHDHAKLVCDRRNEKDGPGTWRITPIPDDHRRNIIYNYGATENFEDFFNKRPQPRTPIVKESPTLNNCEINLKSLERREMMRMSERKVKKELRITLKRNNPEPKAKTGIFSNGIQGNSQQIIIPEQCKNPSPSTSSIYLTSHASPSSDYENDLFNEPEDIDQAQFQHQQDLSNCGYYGQDWFDNTANFTQTQSPNRVTGFIPRHRDYYHFRSQR